MFEECFGDGPFIFRINNDNSTGPSLLLQVCLERGWREYNPENNEQWNLWWRSSGGFPINQHRGLYAWQYLNHIPKSSTICRKDNLVRYMRCMKKVYGPIYDFSPLGYNLPLEYTKLAAEYTKVKNNRPFSAKSESHYDFFEDKPVWICKPVAQSQGKGIFLFRKLSELSYDSNTIVQRYIEKPLLIGGYKFDLRLYVCVPSYHPITIYLYQEGLARFGTDKFSLNDLRNPFRHLTNSSINKLGPGYTEMKERIGSGCKWSLKQLRKYFNQNEISDWLLWQRISSLVVLTVLSHMSQIPPTVNCFEFFGFDVLIDSSLRPWLLEVNLSPGLSLDCDTDRLVKKPMLHDMFDLLGLPMYNTGLSVFGNWQDGRENLKNFSRSKLSVANIAEKWRNKPRRASSRSTSAATSNRNGRKSAFSRSSMNLPKVSPNSKSFDRDYFNENFLNGKKWGNGRDWNYPSDREGGWIRIWPMTLELGKNPTAMKNMVAKVVKYMKTAKELFKEHPTASELQLNEFLLQELDISGEIWMPLV